MIKFLLSAMLIGTTTLLGACGPQAAQNTAPAASAKSEPALGSPSSAGLTQRQIQWLNRVRARPAGR
ncbi:MAG: hypothetical protein AAF439_03810 [Pseudomonadota bacterium]